MERSRVVRLVRTVDCVGHDEHGYKTYAPVGMAVRTEPAGASPKMSVQSAAKVLSVMFAEGA
jgi:hypothetical protein